MMMVRTRIMPFSKKTKSEKKMMKNNVPLSMRAIALVVFSRKRMMSFNFPIL